MSTVTPCTESFTPARFRRAAPASFIVRAISGTVALGGEALAALLEGIVFHYSGRPSPTCA